MNELSNQVLLIISKLYDRTIRIYEIFFTIKKLIVDKFINIHIVSRQMNVVKINLTKQLQLLQNILKKNKYLSGEELPNGLDGRIFLLLEKINIIPNRQDNPALYHWFIILKQFAKKIINIWIENDQQSYEDNQILIRIMAFDVADNLSDTNSSQCVKDINVYQCQNKDILKLKKYQMIVRIRKGFKIPTYKHKHYFQQSRTDINITKYKPSKDQQLNNIIKIQFTGSEEQSTKLKDQIAYWSEVESIQIRKQKNVPLRLYTL